MQNHSTVITIAGDSGDGVQLLGSRFITETARTGQEIASLPEFPAEIRAPVGSLFGVSSYSLNFGLKEIRTAGDEADLLVALNPAALKVGIKHLSKGKTIILDSGSFTTRALKKAKYETDPRAVEASNKDSLANYKVINLDITKFTLDALAEDFSLSRHEALQSKNMWILGYLLQGYGFSIDQELSWLAKKFSGEVCLINQTSLKAGYNFAEISEFVPIYGSSKTSISNKSSRNFEKLQETKTVTGAETIAWGLVASAIFLETKLSFSSYPITPASPLLQNLAKESFSNARIEVRQAEDEIAAAGFALGSGYGGSVGVTATSGPGINLISETLALAQALEIPLIAIDIMRAGPSTGMPTKPEQSDLEASIYGRHGESPIPVLAIRSASTAFSQILTAVKIAYKSSTPIIVLSDAIINSSTRLWHYPKLENEVAEFNTIREDSLVDSESISKASTIFDLPSKYQEFFLDEKYQPYNRNPKTLSRFRALPYQKFFQHRLGGLEKENITGNISYDDKNHAIMTELRQQKVAKILDYYQADEIELGSRSGKVLLISFGSVSETCYTATQELIEAGYEVSHLCLTLLYPLNKNLKKIISCFEKIIVCEMNSGQLMRLIREATLEEILSLTKITGRPFKIAEVIDFVKANY